MTVSSVQNICFSKELLPHIIKASRLNDAVNINIGFTNSFSPNAIPPKKLYTISKEKLPAAIKILLVLL